MNIHDQGKPGSAIPGSIYVRWLDPEAPAWANNFDTEKCNDCYGSKAPPSGTGMVYRQRTKKVS